MLTDDITPRYAFRCELDYQAGSFAYNSAYIIRVCKSQGTYKEHGSIFYDKLLFLRIYVICMVHIYSERNGSKKFRCIFQHIACGDDNNHCNMLCGNKRTDQNNRKTPAEKRDMQNKSDKQQ